MEAVSVNSVFNSSPVAGSTDSKPGKGGALVVTTTLLVLVAPPVTMTAVNVNVYSTPSLKLELDNARLWMKSPETVVVTGVMADVDKSTLDSDTDHSATATPSADILPANLIFWSALIYEGVLDAVLTTGAPA
jgi:hypothetical protein